MMKRENMWENTYLRIHGNLRLGWQSWAKFNLMEYSEVYFSFMESFQLMLQGVYFTPVREIAENYSLLENQFKSALLWS